MLTRLMGMRDYTRAELVLAVQRVPFDSRASHNFGRGLNVADVERVIMEHRKLRAMIDRVVTEFQMRKLCEEFATEIEPDHFGVCGYDADDRPLWRYAKPGHRPKEREWGSDFGAELDQHGPTALLPEHKRTDDGAGPSPFGRVE